MSTGMTTSGVVSRLNTYELPPHFFSCRTFAVAQSTKFFISWFAGTKENDVISTNFWELVECLHLILQLSALATAVGLQEGFGAALFATSLILACIDTCDATGLRLHAGRQAMVLNQIVYELPASHPLS
ncbi:hypothetical protein SLEP1_g31614 [Rubroshorea leprosula]|uniref:Uncharacterized protein n=1 Tax=Rubroshorea leprosula TaxID=152421 RepID=A0AAV5K602_9ROSI|nr:hypothetical protein SLEP1_g31614 [Rubroshorea leprosula]